MANLLIFSKDLPFPLEKGNTLRVYHPCRQLAKTHTCTLVTFGEKSAHVDALAGHGIFNDIHILPPPSRTRSFWRHIRWSDKNYFKRSMPAFYKETLSVLKEQIRKHRIDIVIIFPAILTEYVEPLRNVAKIADSCDSLTLSYERLLTYRRKSMSPRIRLATWMTLQRARQFEKRLSEVHDRIVSISPADFGKLETLNPKSLEKIRLIPNGVNPEVLVHTARAPEIKDAIIFWGNLKFPPNYTAVHYFYDAVYKPYLAEKNIKWFIVGSNADEKIRSMAAENSHIVVTGFVEDLYDLAARIPIMINPMRIGSGLKNKVLEAFALRRLVVSSALGMEAIVGAQPGVHYVRAEHPRQIARAILDNLTLPLERQRYGNQARRLVEAAYTWDIVGRQWHRLVEEVDPTPAIRGNAADIKLVEKNA